MRLCRSYITYTIMLILITVLAMGGTARGASHFRVIDVIDGDTVKVYVGKLPGNLGNTLNLRVHGVDTPEKGWRAKCDRERELGAKATEFVKVSIRDAKTVSIRLDGFEKYGGRVLGDIRVDGQWLSALLIAANLAAPYDGHGPKRDWCAETVL